VNESSAFQLFLMGKFTLIYECFGLQARLYNGLCSQSKVLLYNKVRISREGQRIEGRVRNGRRGKLLFSAKGVN
jgi:hypothetical protein